MEITGSLGGMKPERDRIWGEKGLPWNIMLYTPLPRAVIFSKGIVLRSLEISFNSGRSLGCSWKMINPYFCILFQQLKAAKLQSVPDMIFCASFFIFFRECLGRSTFPLFFLLTGSVVKKNEANIFPGGGRSCVYFLLFNKNLCPW